MKRRMPGLWTFCLISCTAACVLWARSYQVGHKLSWRGQAHNQNEFSWWDLDATSALGMFRLNCHGRWNADGRAERGFSDAELGLSLKRRKHPYEVFVQTDGPPPRFDYGGFVIDWNIDTKVDSHFHSFIFVGPDWILLLVFGIPVLLGTWRWRSRRVSPTQCAACNYDLRATPERCPECGARGN